MSPVTPPAMPISSLNGSSPPWNGSKDHPRSGGIVPDLGEESIREIIHGKYRIVVARDSSPCARTSRRAARGWRSARPQGSACRHPQSGPCGGGGGHRVSVQRVSRGAARSRLRRRSQHYPRAPLRERLREAARTRQRTCPSPRRRHRDRRRHTHGPAALKATRTIPIVMGCGGDPVRRRARSERRAACWERHRIDLPRRRDRRKEAGAPQRVGSCGNPCRRLWVPETGACTVPCRRKPPLVARHRNLSLFRCGPPWTSMRRSRPPSDSGPGGSRSFPHGCPPTTGRKSSNKRSKHRLPGGVPRRGFRRCWAGSPTDGASAWDNFQPAAAYVDKIPKGAWRWRFAESSRTSEIRLVINLRTGEGIWESPSHARRRCR